MTLILRKRTAEDRVEGRQPLDWAEYDYAVVDETPIGRIFKQQMAAGPKWVWFLQVVPVPRPNEGVADTLDEARAALAKRYGEARLPGTPSPGDRTAVCLLSILPIAARPRRYAHSLIFSRNALVQRRHGIDSSLVRHTRPPDRQRSWARHGSQLNETGEGENHGEALVCVLTESRYGRLRE